MMVVAGNNNSMNIKQSTQNDDNGGNIESLTTDKLTILSDSVKNPGALQTRPWNLRTRRAAVYKWDPDHFHTQTTKNKTTKKLKKIDGINGDGCGVEEGRTKLSVSLTQKEIAEDFLAMTGKAPSKRPNKRPRKIQNYIDDVSPGFHLTEVTASKYESSRKR